MSDAELVRSLLTLEQAMVYAYEHVPAAPPAAHEFVRQESEHGRVLGVAARRLGAVGALPGGEKALGKLELSRSVVDVRSEKDALDFLLELEDVAVGAYFRAIPKLSDPALIRTAAQIMANEAQHVALLRELRRPHEPARAVPTAFVQGKD